MNKKKRLFFPGLNELRALAALAVLVHHVEEYKHGLKLRTLHDFGETMKSFISDLGYNGVMLFFVLSGFLITYLLIEEKKTTGKIAVSKFYGRRILRIWPLYFIIVIVGFFIIPHIYHSFPEVFKGQSILKFRIENLTYGNNLILFLFFMSNIAMSIYGPVAGSSQSWSVSIEEQFYVVWPWIVKLFYKNLLLVLMLIILGSVFFKYLLPETIIGKIYYVSRIDYMATGATIAYLFRHFKEQRVVVLKNKVFIVVLAVSVTLHLFFKISNVTQAITFGLLIVSCIEHNFNVKALSYIGKLSYGVYMYHPFMMYLSFSIMSKLHINNVMHYNVLTYAMVLGFTFLLSYLSYNYIELYFLKIKSRFSSIKSGDN